MPTDNVLLDVNAGVATVTLNRPAVLNATSAALLGDLLAAFERIEQGIGDGGVRAVLLTGAGRGFCSGADLTDPALAGSGTPDLAAFLHRYYHPLIRLMRRLPAPIVVAVNGVAAGAGMSLALAGDVVLAARSATFLQAFSRIGLVPDAGSTYFLPRLIGEGRARALAILADKLDAEQALQFGLVWQVHDDDALLPAARALAERLATQPTRAFALIKEAMNQSLDNPLAAQLEVEADAQGRAGRTEDFREGVAAFLGKRRPQFKGR
ncbi:MAG: enoyl-CoA hydratase-related protein [Lautropia sp.]